MARPPKERKIEQIPPVDLYKPSGIPLRDIDEIVLTFEEMEAVRLADVEQLDQAAAAERMEVSRPTFNRIINKAHQKIGEALWQGKALRFEGGAFRICRMHQHRLRKFVCNSCGYEWSVPCGNRQCGRNILCPQCQSGDIKRTE